MARSQVTNKKKKAPLFIKAKPPSSYLRFFFFFLNPGTFSKNAFFFLPLPSFFPGWLADADADPLPLPLPPRSNFLPVPRSPPRSLLRSLRPPRFFLPVLGYSITTGRSLNLRRGVPFIPTISQSIARSSLFTLITRIVISSPMRNTLPVRSPIIAKCCSS